MRSPFLGIVFGVAMTGFFIGKASADCYMEGHPICSMKCDGWCRAFYDPGPPEKCDKECRNFKVMISPLTVKLEGITPDQLDKIKAILKGK